MKTTILERNYFTSPYKRAGYVAGLTTILQTLKGEELKDFCARLEKQGYSVMESKVLSTGEYRCFVV